MSAMIKLKRVYDRPSPDDGHRVLVDRIWPRGLSKADAAINEWLRDTAPSTVLRKSFHSNRLSWSEFRRCYLSELRDHREQLRNLAQRSRHEAITLVFGAKDLHNNNAVVLAQYLKMLGGC